MGSESLPYCPVLKTLSLLILIPNILPAKNDTKQYHKYICPHLKTIKIDIFLFVAFNKIFFINV